jgi:large subunit ribosomal protein L3
MEGLNGLIGKKLGITQIFATDGTAIPVTIVQAGPCLVTQRKTRAIDGYEAVQLGFVEERPARGVSKAMRGHFKKAEVAPVKRLQEFLVAADNAAQPGDQIKVAIFAVNEYVDVVGTSKGKGFQGVMKRHNFRGGRASHGSMFHRAPGSIGSSSFPSRVFPGMRMAGRMGGERVTVKNLLIVKVDEEKHLLYIRGAVPGPPNSYVAIQRAKRG